MIFSVVRVAIAVLFMYHLLNSTFSHSILMVIFFSAAFYIALSAKNN